MFEGLLPIGTVVMLKNSTKRVMIIGVCQKQANISENKPTIWDYSGVVYPEGYLGIDQTYLFNDDQIERMYAIGYQDEEQFSFKIRADNALKELRGEDLTTNKQ